MKRFLIPLLLSGLPLAALAQENNVEAEFGAAFETYFPSGEADLALNAAEGIALVPRLAGVWAPAHILFPDGQFNEGRFDTACTRLSALRIAPTGRFGFTITQLRGGEETELVTTYAFVAGSTFTRTTDLDGRIAEIFRGQDLENLDPGVWMPAINGQMTHGYAIVRMPSPNIAVIESVGGTPFLLARCP